MQPPVIQRIPITSLAFLATLALSTNASQRLSVGSQSAATVEWQVVGEMPTQSFDSTPQDVRPPSAAAPALSLISLARAVIPDSRPMSDWERNAADEFFWSQFE